MRLYVALCASALVLAGCASPSPLQLPFGHDAVVPKPLPVRIPCSTPDVWSADEFRALAKALEPLRDDPVVSKESVEWMRLRAEAKACQGTQD